MSSLKIVADMKLHDASAVASSRTEYLAGITNVDFFGPAQLIVNEEGRQRELNALVNAISLAWDEERDRSTAMVAALRDAANRIEGGSNESEELMPILLSVIAKAVRP
jgi:hypothetical protein